MIQTHLTVEGGEQWLSWAYGRERALRALGTPYMTRRWDMGDGTTVTVRITPDASYIELRGTGMGGYLCWPHSKSSPTGVWYDPTGKPVEPTAKIGAKDPTKFTVEEHKLVVTGNTDWTGVVGESKKAVTWTGRGSIRHRVKPTDDYLPSGPHVWFEGQKISTRVLVPGKGTITAVVLGACINVETKRIVFVTNGGSHNNQTLHFFSRPMAADPKSDWRYEGSLTSTETAAPDNATLGFTEELYFDSKGEKFATISARVGDAGVYSPAPKTYEYREGGRKYTGKLTLTDGKLVPSGSSKGSATTVTKFVLDPDAYKPADPYTESPYTQTFSWKTWLYLNEDSHVYQEASVRYTIVMGDSSHTYTHRYADIVVTEMLGVDFDRETGAEVEFKAKITVHHIQAGYAISRIFIRDSQEPLTDLTEIRPGSHVDDASELVAAEEAIEAFYNSTKNPTFYDGKGTSTDVNKVEYFCGTGSPPIAVGSLIEMKDSSAEYSDVRGGAWPSDPLLPGETSVRTHEQKSNTLIFAVLDLRTRTYAIVDAKHVQNDPDMSSWYKRSVTFNVKSALPLPAVTTVYDAGEGHPFWEKNPYYSSTPLARYTFPGYAIVLGTGMKNCFATRSAGSFIMAIDMRNLYIQLDAMKAGYGWYERKPFVITDTMCMPYFITSTPGFNTKFTLSSEPEFSIAPITIF